MANPPPATKRRYERFKTENLLVEAYRLSIIPLFNSHKNIAIRGVDISECGIQLVVGARLDAGMHLRISARVPKIADVIEGEVAVRWCVANGKRTGEFLIGAEFVRMPDGTLTKIQALRRYYRSAEYKQGAAGLLTKQGTTQPAPADGAPPPDEPKSDGGGLSIVNNPNT
jgi:hypothetical protein